MIVENKEELFQNVKNYVGLGDVTIPIGSHENREISWSLSTANNMILTGRSGSGKSVIMSRIATHCAANNWSVYTIDGDGFGVNAYTKNVHEIAKTTVMDSELQNANMEPILKLLHELKAELEIRYAKMESSKVTHFDMLNVKLKPIMLVIDEASFLLYPDSKGHKTSEQVEACNILRPIAKLGKAAGIHILLSSQTMDGSYLSKEFRSQFGCRMVIGHVGHQASEDTLGNDSAFLIPDEPKAHRVGYIQHFGVGTRVQVPTVDLSI